MSSSWPEYPVSVVGSWPRPAWLLDARKKRPPADELAALEDEATLLAIKWQEDAGVDVLSDGEQRRDNFYSFVCDRLDGVELMSLAQLLDHVEDKAGFEALLRALDVPAFAIKNPTVTGKLSARRPLALDDARFLRAHTTRPIKVALPGPYLLSRATWVKGLSEGAYPTRAALADDVVAILRAEVQALAAAGVDVIQLDEPVLTELVFAGKSATRTFMCAALAASAHPRDELEMAVDLVNRVTDGLVVDGTPSPSLPRRAGGGSDGGPLVALHVCRGNWSPREDVLLSGGYEALLPWLARMRVGQLVLEHATPRAGGLDALRGLPPGVSLGLGCVNPRVPPGGTPQDEAARETPAAIAARVRAAEAVVGRGRIHLVPDCGFGTFADRPVATARQAFAKLRALSGAAALLRG